MVWQVELWLTNLEEAMREAVRRHIAEAVAQYEERLWEQWVLEQPAQVVLTASQIWWSTDVGLAFQRLVEGYDTALRDYSKKQVILPDIGFFCLFVRFFLQNVYICLYFEQNGS